MKSKLLIILFVVMPFFLHAQVRTQSLTGKVVSGPHALKGILIVNVKAEREARTDKNGVFKIKAQVGDTLVVTDTGIVPAYMVVSESSFKTTSVIEVVLTDAYELEVLTVEKNRKLTAEALRIVPKGQAKYTPAERKAKTAARVGPRADSVMGGGVVINGDAIINSFNGRRKAVKKAVEVEKAEQNIEILSATYDEETLIEQYSIPKEYTKGFLYYAVEDERLAKAIKDENATLVETLISELALNYLERIKDEK